MVKIMPFFEDKRKLAIFAIIAIAIPILLSLIISKFGLFGLKKLPIPFSSHQASIQLPKVETKSADGQQGPFNCPSQESFCQNGKDVLRGGKYIGLGGQIATGSAIIASFDGDLSVVTNTLSEEFHKEQFLTVYLDDKDRGLRGIYYYKGQAPKLGRIKAGDMIATVQGPIYFYDNNSLIFALVKNDFISNKPSPVTSKDFKYDH